MNSDVVTQRASTLTARWWTLVARGVAAILFGVLAILVPTGSLHALAMGWCAYAVVNGALALMLAARRGRGGLSWGWLLFEGAIGIAAGVLMYRQPGITALTFVTSIAIWAVLTGIAEIATAFQLRREVRDEWMLPACGALSIVLAILLLSSPAAGAPSIWMIGIYAIALGVLLIELGLRLHRWREPNDLHLPASRAPTRA